MNLEGSNATMPVQNVIIRNNTFNWSSGALTVTGTVADVEIYGNTFIYPIRIADENGYTQSFTNVQIHDNDFVLGNGKAYDADSGNTYDGIVVENNT